MLTVPLYLLYFLEFTKQRKLPSNLSVRGYEELRLNKPGDPAGFEELTSGVAKLTLKLKEANAKEAKFDEAERKTENRKI